MEQWELITLKLENLELDLLPGIGGRLWDIKFHGNSLLFQNSDLTGLSFDLNDLAALPTRSPQFGFPLWGGEKTWIAPDSLWPNGKPFLALDSRAYTVTSQNDEHLEMVSEVCPVSKLSVCRQITLTSAKSWTIKHRLRNHDNAARRSGIWSVMMLDNPATIGIAMKMPSFFTVFGSDKGLVAQKHNCIVVDCSKRQEFKIGLPNPNGHTLIKFGNKGPWLQCSVPATQQDDQYAHDHPFEVFNSGDYDYCEAEWHSPAQDLKPDEEMHFAQSFQICENGSEAQTFKNHTELISCMS